MTKNKERQIQKLKKIRVWPSISMFLSSLFLSLLTFTVIMMAYLSLGIEIQFNQAMTATDNVSQVIAERTEAGQNVSEAVEAVLNGKYGVDSVYVLDKDGNTIAGSGSETFRYDKSVMSGENAGLTIYPDEEMSDFINIEDSSGKITVSGKVSTDFLRDSFSGGDTELTDDYRRSVQWLSENVLSEPYWLKSTDLPDGSQVLVRQYINETRRDFIYGTIIGAVAATLMTLTSFSMFIHSLKGVGTQKKMRKLLFIDPVTGGNNWYYFRTTAEKTLKSRANANKFYAVIDLTLMKYRNYCICNGTQAGEELLEKIDSFLEKNTLRGECYAHSAKSSFAVLIKCNSADECEQRIRSWMAQLPSYIGYPGAIFHAGICFIPPEKYEGEVFINRRALDISEIYTNAGTARAAIDGNEQSATEIFGQRLLEEQRWEHQVEENMESALANGEFKVFVQPKYNPVTDELAGGEALIRWVSPAYGFISPGKFIPIFEKNGFITKIDDYMISSVAALQAKWLKEGKKVVPVSVNVSRAHFSRPDLAEHICALVDAHNVPHNLVEIELTESAFFDDKAMLLSTVKKLKDLGFEISMDDFGAGYSSLNSLKDLPLDVLKLDAEFFRGENAGERGEIVVSEAIQLAKSLNMRIVAEGVEKQEQVKFLADNGCDMIQGFYYAKPMPADEFEGRMDSEPKGLPSGDDYIAIKFPEKKQAVPLSDEL